MDSYKYYQGETDEKYINLNKKWENNFKNIKDYIDKNNKPPSTQNKNKEIKLLGYWLSNQKTNFNEDITQSKFVMKNKIIHKIWSEFINDEKYKNTKIVKKLTKIKLKEDEEKNI